MAGQRARYRWLAAGLLPAGLALWAAHSADPMRVSSGGAWSNLAFAADLEDNLALIYERFETEVILCLEGRSRARTLEIVDFRMPHIRKSTSRSAASESCAKRGRFVGSWHNHLPDPWEPGGHRHHCYLSPLDIEDFMRQAWALVTVVACGPRSYAYWWREDVAPRADSALILWPLEGQLVIRDPGAKGAPAH